MKQNPLRAHIKFIVDNYLGDEAVDMIFRVLAPLIQPRPPVRSEAPRPASSPTAKDAPAKSVSSKKNNAKEPAAETTQSKALKSLERLEYYSVEEIAQYMKMTTGNVYTMIGRDPEAFPCQMVKNTGAGRRERKVYLGRGILDWQVRRRRGAISLVGIPGRQDEPGSAGER
jgi:hypothetical protein